MALRSLGRFKAAHSIALSAVGFFGLTCLAQQTELRFWLVLSGCLLCIGSYGLDGLIDPQEQSGTPRIGYAWVALALTLAFLCAAGSGEVRFGVFAVVLFPTSVIAYSAEVLPSRFRYRRIKDVPYLKSFYVAALWACLAFMVAGGAEHRSPCVYLYIGLWVLIGTVFGDLKDVVDDKIRNVRTLPTSVGISRTYRILHLASWSLAGLVIVAVIVRALPAWFVFVELRAPIWAALMTFARRGRWHLVFASQVGYDLVAVTLLPLAWLGRSMLG